MPAKTDRANITIAKASNEFWLKELRSSKIDAETMTVSDAIKAAMGFMYPP